MTRRFAVTVILLAVATAAATSVTTTAGIMLYQAGRFVDRLADTLAPEDCSSDDCMDQMLDGTLITKDEHRRVMDALFGRAI